jgi:hypothetical protein
MSQAAFDLRAAEQSIAAQIERLVGAAEMHHRILNAREEAARLVAGSPSCWWALEDVAMMIAEHATSAGVALEL